MATQGEVYLDGRRGTDRWLIHLPPEVGMRVRGSEQEGGVLLLDAEVKVVEQILN